MKLTLLLSTCVALSAQQTVMFKPLPIHGTAAVFGPGTAIGLWSVSVCNAAAAPVAVPRERIMQLAPALHELPNSLAQDVLNRKAGSSKSAIAVDLLTVLGNFSSTGLTAAGIATGSANASIAGAGLAGITVVVQLLRKRTPDPTPYFGDFLPAQVGLGPAACGSWVVGAALMHDPVTLGPFTLP